MDGPTPGYVTILVEATVEPGVVIARHTHPGIETSYVIEGAIELPIKGQDTKTYSAGESYQVPAETPHAGGKASDKRIKVATTYVVEKGKPLASPA
jgi:quercetin dioxygenase-like cupin family protein